MKKTYKLEGLGCANCAAKIQDGIAKINGVRTVNVNFLTTKLTIDCDEDKVDNIIETVKEIIERIEPDVVMWKA